MNRRLWLAGIVTTVCALTFAMLIHGVLAAGEYAENAAAYRPIAASTSTWEPC